MNNRKIPAKKAGYHRTRTDGEKRAMPLFVKYGLAAVAIIAAIVAGLAIYFNAAGGYVAVIDGERIGTDEFEYELEMQKELMYYEASRVDPSISEETFWATKINGEDAGEVAKSIAMDALKSVKVQYKKAKDAGIALTGDEMNSIDNYIKESIIDTMGGGNRLKANAAFKEQYGVSIDFFKKYLVQDAIIKKYVRQEMDKITVGEADIEDYYKKNPDWFKEARYRSNGEEAVWARHILIKVDESASREEKDAALKKAGELVEKLKGGADFKELVAENSEDDGSKSRGGDYVFGRNALFYDEFKDAAFKLEPGGFTLAPVKTEAGYHIIKTEEKYAKDEPVSLKCAKEYYEYGADHIKYMLYQEKVKEWVDSAEYKLNQPVYNSIG